MFSNRAACLFLLTGIPGLVAQGPPGEAGGARVVIRGTTESLFDGATVAASVPAGSEPALRASATVADRAFELSLPSASRPVELVVAWSPRLRQAFSLGTPALAAAWQRQADGSHLLDVRLLGDGVVPTATAEEAPGPPALAGRYAGRARARGGAPDEALRAMAAALEPGLAWLLAQQRADGDWPATTEGDPPGAIASRSLATSAACMTILASGSTVRSGPHRPALMRGICWLVEQTDAKTGRLARPSSVAPLEEQALLALVLHETFVLAGFEPLRDPTDASVSALADMLGDASISDRREVVALGFAALALASARQTFGPHDEVFATVMPALTADSADVGSLHDAVALLAGQFLSDPVLAAAARRAPRLLDALPAQGPNLAAAYVYFATMALYQAGEPHWTAWRTALAKGVVSGQLREGDHAGSWPPTDPAAQLRGRVWNTALRLLSIQVVVRTARVVRGK